MQKFITVIDSFQIVREISVLMFLNFGLLCGLRFRIYVNFCL